MLKNIYDKINEKMVLIEARDKPKNLKVTSLQLIVFCFNCFKRSSFDRICLRFSAVQTVASSKTPC